MPRVYSQNYYNPKRDYYNTLSAADIIRLHGPGSNFNFSNYLNNYYNTAYTASANALRSEYQYAQDQYLGRAQFTAYPIYNPTSLYTNTNAAYIRRLERSMYSSLYNIAVRDVDASGLPARLGRMADGDRIRRDRFNEMYSDGAFASVDSNLPQATNQIRTLERFYANGKTEQQIGIKAVSYKDSNGDRIAYQVKNGVIGQFQQGEFIPSQITINGKVAGISIATA